MTKLPIITGTTWFNSAPLASSDLVDKIVLVYFWSYTSINSLHMVPYLNSWQKKYQDKGLLIIGIHTPQFAFEKVPDVAEASINDLHITWPVVLDNNYANWDTFGNHYWPIVLISDKEGDIVYVHAGDDALGETESTIQKLLNVSDEPLVSVHEHNDDCIYATPTMALGSIHANDDLVLYPDILYTYSITENPSLNSIKLSGPFIAHTDNVESQGQNASILVSFEATKVDVVLSSSDNAEIEVLLNGFSLPISDRGIDIDSSGIVHVTTNRLYTVVHSSIPVQGILELRVINGTACAYIFTFSGCPQNKAE